MGFFSLLICFLAIGISTAALHENPDGPGVPTHRASFDGAPVTVITVDWLFSSGSDVAEATSTAAEVDYSTYAKGSVTTICAPQCSVLTLTTVTGSQEKWHVQGCSVHSVSLIDLVHYHIQYTDPVTVDVVSRPYNDVLDFMHDKLDKRVYMVMATSTGFYTTSTITTSLTPIIEWTSTTTSTVTVIESSISTDDALASEPCTTEITVTMTKTIVETYQSKTPVTATLIRTRPITVETVVVETYSTSTGESVVEGTRTETTIVQAVSSDTECLEAGKCCAACSVTVASEAVETLSSLFEESASAVEDSVSSAVDSMSLSAVYPSGTLATGGTVVSTLGISETPETTITETAPSSGPETVGPTSILTAGAAQVTAVVGIGAIVGLMGLLA
ncbi:hypothetical protein FZEAL_5193 [Fusarium zealandicum]|uniref:Uncharacterized protein n=1 Tax=Fusarium zealandicum TaxID=1053134 RepID=A0A8H4UKW5_9HYPO|nr:hypothetical protein FZEAL_5193 [Fusarium zealandicum]